MAGEQYYYGMRQEPNKEETWRTRTHKATGDFLDWGRRTVDDLYSAETVSGPSASSYYYGGSEGFMPARSAMLDQRGDLAYGQGQQSLEMTRQAALGRGPSAAAALARAQADASQRGGLSLARSGRAGTGSSATRDALFANAQTQQAGNQAAAMARAQEQMAAQQQYAAQTMAMQQQAASEAARMREAQLEANARYESGKLDAARSNQDADIRKDQSNMAFGGAIFSALGGLSDENSKRRIADLEAEVSYYRKREGDGGEVADLRGYDVEAGDDPRGKSADLQYGDDDPGAETRAYQARRIGRQGDGGPPDLDPADVAAWLESQGERAPEPPEDIARRRAVSAAQHQARADSRRMGRGPLSALRADLRAGQEASDTFAAMRPMAYEYREPGPGAPPGPQVGFSAQSVQGTPAGRAMTEPGPDGRLRYDGQKALQLTMAGTADQEKRLRELEAAVAAKGGGNREHRVTVEARASRGDMRRRLGLQRIADPGTPLADSLRDFSYYGARGGR